MYTGQNIVRLAYGDKLIRPKTPKVKTLPIAHNITEAHSDFPLYIKPSAITGFGSLTLAEAQSLRFYADSAKTTELPREIVSADEIYVKTSLATGTGNKVYLDWDGVSSDYAVSDTYGARNVWNSWNGVYNYGKGNSIDSSPNGNNGSDSNITYANGYASFNGSNSRIVLSNTLPNSREQTTITVAYKKPNNTYDGALVSMWVNSGWFFIASTNDWRTTTSSASQSIGFSSPQNTNINYYTFVSDGSNNNNKGKIYINGAIIGTTTYSFQGVVSTLSTYAVGNQDTNRLNGYIYSVKITNQTLSPSRISTEYANQSNPATFFGTLT